MSAGICGEDEERDLWWGGWAAAIKALLAQDVPSDSYQDQVERKRAADRLLVTLREKNRHVADRVFGAD